jgi:phosphate acyltransferase
MVAVDVMGGDYSPKAILEGALLASREGVSIALFGPHKLISKELDRIDEQWKTFELAIYDAPEQIGMDEDSVRSVRKKRNSSIVRAFESVRDGICRSVVSAGNSGALMVASTLILGCERKINRPAIAGLIPTKSKNSAVGLDLGANTECRPEHLFQFAQIGSDYANRLFHIDNPRVGLLSNGHEKGKGSILTKQAFNLIAESGLNFIGNIEPDFVLNGGTDVVVCDGFTGNILLKTLEACLSLFSKISNGNLKSNFLSNFIQNHGAPLLGVNGTVIICHGNSDAQTIKRSILFAKSSSQKTLNTK